MGSARRRGCRTSGRSWGCGWPRRKRTPATKAVRKVTEVAQTFASVKTTKSGLVEVAGICMQIPWDCNSEAAKWATGKTGFPWIDAIMTPGNPSCLWPSWPEPQSCGPRGSARRRGCQTSGRSWGCGWPQHKRTPATKAVHKVTEVAQTFASLRLRSLPPKI